jgi:pentatricopeptide repeat protein
MQTVKPSSLFLQNFERNLEGFFTSKKDKRLSFHKLLQEYSNRPGPVAITANTINAMMTILQHSHGTTLKEKSKVLEWIKLDLDYSKNSISAKTYHNYDTRIELYRNLFGKPNMKKAVDIVKGNQVMGRSVMCLLVRVQYEQCGSVACYKWMKSLLLKPWEDGDVPVYFQWCREACQLVLQYLCKDHKMDIALQFMEEIEELDIKLDTHSYNHILSGFVRQYDFENALKIFEKLKQNTIPNQVSYNWMAQLYLTDKKYYVVT